MSKVRRLRLWGIYQEGREYGIKKATAAERERMLRVAKTVLLNYMPNAGPGIARQREILDELQFQLDLDVALEEEGYDGPA